MQHLQKFFYIILKLLAVSGFAVLFYFMVTDVSSTAPIFTFSMLTSLCLIAIQGMKTVFENQEDSQHHGS